MKIVKQQLKKALSNKVVKSQLTPYNFFYIIIDSTQTITNTIKKKSLTKLSFRENFSSLKNISFIYPVNYISANNLSDLITIYKQFRKDKDFEKILICNIKANFLVFKDFKLLSQYNIDNTTFIFYKLYLLLNGLLLNFIFLKNIDKK